MRKHWLATIMLGKYVVGDEKTEIQNGSCPVDRGRSREMKMLRSKLWWMVCLTSRAMVLFGLGLLPRVMSGPVALPQP